MVNNAACPVCGCDGAFVLEAVDRELDPPFVIRIFECGNCETVYHHPRMSQASMIEYYRSGVYRTYKDRAIDEGRALERASQSVDMIDKFTYMNPGRCLDVGCSRGYLSRAIHDKFGVEAIGYDVYADPDAVIPVTTGKNEITGKFDLITCIHVLEHLYDPMAELAWMKSLLNDNGALMIEIPFTRKVMVPHPTIFSRKSIPLLMKHIGARYVLLDAINYDTGVIFAKIGSGDGFSFAIR